MDGIIIGVCVLCLILSAYFSASETAYLSFNRIRMKTLAEESKRARLVLRLADQSDKIISTILVGNNIVNITLTSLATVLFLGWLPANGATVSTVVVTAVVLIFGEISPKTIAKQKADAFIYATAPILNFFLIILTPVTVLFRALQKFLGFLFRSEEDDGISEDELKTFVEEAEEDGGITKQAGELIRSAIEFNDRDVAEILTPRVSVIAVEENDPREEIAQKFRETGFSRLPVYTDTIDGILGVIHEKDFFAASPDTPLTELLTPALCVPPHMKISVLLKRLQKEKNHLAVVVDEFGGTEGIVTLEDILEELVGEIWDEHDTVTETVRQIEDRRFRIAGDAERDEIFERFGLTDEESDAVTVGGWVLQRLGKIPEPGESFRWQTVTVRVTAVENRRITLLEIEQDAPKTEAEDG